MKLDTEKVWLNTRQASTDDLLDRVTVYRDGLEPVTLAIIEAELRDRGITADAVHAHARAYGEDCLRDADGVVLECSRCRKPAVAEEWAWHFVLGLVPVFRRRVRYCREHQPK
jgi:hypothetical protein